MSIAFVDPETHEPLRCEDGVLRNQHTGEVVARVVDGIPRFVEPEANYAESFGWQWKTWEHVRSISRGAGQGLRRTILERTHFESYALEGASLLECGMGGGDDTEVLLELPFAEIHSFDLSTSVERAAKYLADDRLVLSQASIFEIPYPDASFDFVYCHRVLQHTPDPESALRATCRKVRPGGVLFAHSYKRSLWQMLEWRYKLRWLTRRLPREWIYKFLARYGADLHHLNCILYRRRLTRLLAWNFVPFHRMDPASEAGDLPTDALIDFERCVTFDALTPHHDHPMTTRRFVSVIESEGFRIEHLFDPPVSPIYATAVKVGDSGVA